MYKPRHPDERHMRVLSLAESKDKRTDAARILRYLEGVLLQVGAEGMHTQTQTHTYTHAPHTSAGGLLAPSPTRTALYVPPPCTSPCPQGPPMEGEAADDADDVVI